MSLKVEVAQTVLENMGRGQSLLTMVPSEGALLIYVPVDRVMMKDCLENVQKCLVNRLYMAYSEREDSIIIHGLGPFEYCSKIKG